MQYLTQLTLQYLYIIYNNTTYIMQWNKANDDGKIFVV